MNNKTKIIIGVGVAALLLVFRKNLFGGSNGGGKNNSGVDESPNLDKNIDLPVVDYQTFEAPTPSSPGPIVIDTSSASLNTSNNNTPTTWVTDSTSNQIVRTF